MDGNFEVTRTEASGSAMLSDFEYSVLRREAAGARLTRAR